jgi:hypothetical protein
MSNHTPNPFAGWEREGKDCFRFQVRLIDPDLDNGIPNYVAMLGPDDYLKSGDCLDTLLNEPADTPGAIAVPNEAPDGELFRSGKI